MAHYFERILTRFKIYFFFLILISLGLFIHKLPQLRTELRVFDIYDPNFKSSEDLRHLRTSYGDQNAVQIIANQKRPFTQTQAHHIIQTFRKTARAMPEVVRFISPLDYRTTSWNGTSLWYPPLLQIRPDSMAQLDLSPLRSSAFGSTLVGHGHNLVFDIEFEDTKDIGSYGKFDPAPIGTYFSELQSSLGKEGIELILGGKSAIQWHLKQMFKKDLLVNLSIVLFILMIFRLFYGTWLSGFLFILTLIISSIITFGTMALVKVPVDLLTNSLFMMLVISCLEDFIFISQEMMATGDKSLKTFKNLFVPTFLTSLTTMIGFGSLYFSDLYIIQRFGLLGAMAAFIEWCATLLVLPVVMLMLRPRELNWTNPQKALKFSFITKISQFSPGRRGTHLLLLLGLISLLSFPLINYNEHPDQNFSLHHPHRQYGEFMKKDFCFQGSIFIEFPRSYESLERSVLEKVKKVPNIAAIQSPWEILDFMMKGLPEQLHSLVKIEMRASNAYNKFFSGTGSRSIVFLKSIEQKEINRVIREIKSICGDHCLPVGELVAYDEYSEKISKTLFESLGMSLLIICLIVLALCYMFRIKSKWPIFVSLIWCPAIMIGLLSVTRLPINFITCIVGSIFVGLAGDNVIQFIYSAASHQENLGKGIDSKGPATVQLMLVSTFSCLFFMGFTLVPLRQVGLILMAGFISIYVGDLLVLKGMLKKS